MAHVNARARWWRVQHRQRRLPMERLLLRRQQTAHGLRSLRMPMRMLAGGARSIATGVPLVNSCCVGGSRRRCCHAHRACQRAHSLGSRAATLKADCLASCCSGDSERRIEYAHCACLCAGRLVARAASPQACRWQIAAAQAAANSASDKPIAHVTLQACTLDGDAGAATPQACCLRIAAAQAAADSASSTLIAHVDAHARWWRVRHRQRRLPMDSRCPGGSKRRMGYAHCTCQCACWLVAHAASPQACR